MVRPSVCGLLFVPTVELASGVADESLAVASSGAGEVVGALDAAGVLAVLVVGGAAVLWLTVPESGLEPARSRVLRIGAVVWGILMLPGLAWAVARGCLE